MIKPLQFHNQIFQKGVIKSILAESFSLYGQTRTSYVVNSFKDLGFYYATKSGLSISVEDLQVPFKKNDVIKQSSDNVKQLNALSKSGLLTSIEKSNSILFTWTEATKLLSEMLVVFLKNFNPFNSLYLMVFSGARGNLAQINQLMGLRGLMSDPIGQLLEIPILNNFREGLTLMDYLRATYGARKGLVDTALKTADSGYFTRRLIYSINDLFIKDFNCFTLKFLKIYKYTSKVQFINQLIGRTSVDTIYCFNTSCILIYKNTYITEEIASNLFFSSITAIRIYSVLTCQLSHSVCQNCYGWDVASKNLIQLGSPIGVIAAHSLGEPATQLTMRTFHTGGSFTLSLSRKIFAKFNGFITYSNKKFLEKFRTKKGTYAKFVLKSFFLKFFSYTNVLHHIFLQVNDIVYVVDKQFIRTNTLLAEIFVGARISRFSSFKSILAPHSGELTIISNSNLFVLLNGTVYEFLNGSFLNIFSTLKRYGNPYLFFYFKVYSLISGFFEYSLTGDRLNEIHIIKALHLFIFPLFWDITNHNIIFLGKYNKYFILAKLPFVIHNKILLFAKQQTRRYDTKLSGFLIFVNRKFKKSKNLKKHSLSNFTILLHLPYNYPSFNSINFRKIKPTVNVLVCKFLCCELNLFTINSKTFNRIYFKGEVLFKKFKIPFLTKIFGLIKSSYIYLYCYPLTTITISKNKNFNMFGSINLGIIVKTYFIVSGKNFINFYNGKSAYLLSVILWLKAKESVYKLKFYSFLSSTFLFFQVSGINSIKRTCFVKNAIHMVYNYKFLIASYEYLFQHTIISFLYFQLVNFGAYQKLKKTFIAKPRVLVINSNDLFTFYFETLKQIKTPICFIAYNNLITPFINLLLSGKIYFYGAFSKSLHVGTPFFLSKNVQLFHSSKNFLQKGEVLGFIYFNQILTGDIVQGLPKLEELLELRLTRNSAQLVTQSGLLLPGTFQLNRITISIDSLNPYVTSSSFLANSSNEKFVLRSNLFRKVYSFAAIGSCLSPGSIDFKHLLKTLFLYFLRWQTLYTATYNSFKRIQILLIKKINLIYSKQKIYVSMKHCEVLIRFLTSFICIIYDRSCCFLVGEILTLTTLDNINTVFQVCLQPSVYYEPFIMSLKTSILSSNSFLSASSFQKTTQILCNAALEGKFDWLVGMKENQILGQTILVTNTFSTN